MGRGRDDAPARPADRRARRRRHDDQRGRGAGRRLAHPSTTGRSEASSWGRSRVRSSASPLPFVQPDDASGAFTLTGLQTATDRDPNKLALRPDGAGVYPVEVSLARRRRQPAVELRDTGRRGRAAAERRPRRSASRSTSAWVWPLVTRPGLLPDGTPDPEVVAQLRPGGRIGEQVVTPRRARRPGHARARARDAGDLGGARGRRQPGHRVDARPCSTDALDDAQVLTGPYVPIDVPSLVAGDFGRRGRTTQYDRGYDTLLSGLGVLIDESTAIVDPADARGADAAPGRRASAGSSCPTPRSSRPATSSRRRTRSCSAATLATSPRWRPTRPWPASSRGPTRRRCGRSGSSPRSPSWRSSCRTSSGAWSC